MTLATASVVVCSTCRFSKTALSDAQGLIGGELFERLLHEELAGRACKDQIQIESMACMFACSQHCTVYIRSARRLGYILGGFEPSRVDATALLDYVETYLKTEDGVVTYACWPEGVKGHFLVRVPPDGFAWNSSE